ncbi:MAG: hypothetical protein LBF62_04035 [Tannerellaceae bacterium]|jgi:hypothetical protein|nr:hypothetical protein [Tannerellaceae bacterium]
MERVVLFFVTLLNLSLAGCHPKPEDEPVQTASSIIVKTSNAAEGVAARSEVLETVVFTGNDILWFNETTKELCFKNNFSSSPLNNPFLYARPAIRFYIHDEYLFSTIIVTGLSSRSYNELVFYYSIPENKYFLVDGYPPGLSGAQEERDENMRKIAGEWNRFIEQLKKEGRYKN